MLANHHDHDDVTISAEEMMAFNRLAATVAPEEMSHLRAKLRTLRLWRQADRRLHSWRLENHHLGLVGSGAATIGVALTLTALAVNLAAAVVGLVLMVLGTSCLIRIAERRQSTRDRAAVRLQKIVTWFHTP